MASTLTQALAVPPHDLSSPLSALSVNEVPKPVNELPKPQETHHVVADFNYYKDPGDGSLPPPTIVGKPETYKRAHDTRSVTVHDIRGTEDQYTLDKTGFQIYYHQSVENDFRDEEHIKKTYYPEVENLLKEAFVTPNTGWWPLRVYVDID